MNLILILNIILGYLIGSISFSLIIGKCFYKIDIREHGSKNAGGTNAGRIFGKKAGMMVIILDALKIGISLLIGYLLIQIFKYNPNNEELSLIYFSGLLAVAIGHCYPIYFNFKGGKAVSTMLGLVLFTNYHLIYIFAIAFFLTLIISKMVSLSSMVAAVVVASFSFIPFIQTGMIIPNEYTIYYSLLVNIYALLLIFKHRSNIIRIINGEERKVKWVEKFLKK